MKLFKITLITLGFVLFFVSMLVLFEPINNPTGFFVYTPNIAIINENNNIPLNSNLKIDFLTRGTEDLIIAPLAGEMEVIEVRCNDQIVPNPVIEGIKVTYHDYNCRIHGSVLVKVLSNNLNIGIKFGNNIQQIRNIAP